MTFQDLQAFNLKWYIYYVYVVVQQRVCVCARVYMAEISFLFLYPLLF